ncbi:MAG: helix-turn-helix domain-containing protein [Halosimplex sp.]
MARLEDVAVEELEAALDDATGSRETQRLMAAIIYKRGPSVPMIAEWLDIRDQTIYRWFDRLESEPIERAVRDRERPGRPPKLGDADREAFRNAVREPPTESGYDRPAWTTGLARRFLADEFDVEYSRRHVQRLLNEAGLTSQSFRPGSPTDAVEGDERTEYWVDRD